MPAVPAFSLKRLLVKTFQSELLPLPSPTMIPAIGGVPATDFAPSLMKQSRTCTLVFYFIPGEKSRANNDAPNKYDREYQDNGRARSSDNARRRLRHGGRVPL